MFETVDIYTVARRSLSTLTRSRPLDTNGVRPIPPGAISPGTALPRVQRSGVC
jgi:hypothetical protein